MKIPKKKSLLLLVIAFIMAVSVLAPVSRAAEPVYDIYALKYATLPAFAEPLITYSKGFGKTAKDSPFYFWVIVGNGKKIAFDCGYAPDGWAKKNLGVVGYQSPKQVLAKINMKPEEITDLVISHIHFDHAGNVPAFPNAKIWIQREELEFAAGRCGQSKVANAFVRFKHVMDIVKANYDGRVVLVEGDQPMYPGINLYAVPRGHTYCPQFAVVNTKVGPVVMASDNVYMDRNVDPITPNGVGISMLAMENGIKRMRSFVKDLKYIIPGHDPALLEKFPPVAPNVAKIE